MLGLAPLTGGGLLSAVGLFIDTSAGYVSMLILEDGGTTGGVANANTLITSAMVDTHATLVGNTAWAGATDTEKEQAIYRSMRWISGQEPRMKGHRTWPTTQELPLPRTGVWAFGRQIEYNAIPKEFKQALMEGALLEQSKVDALQPSLEHNIKRQRKKLDGMEKETEYHGSGSVGSVSYPRVMELLAPFLENQSGWDAW